MTDPNRNSGIIPLKDFVQFFLGKEYKEFEAYEIKKNDNDHELEINIHPRNDPGVVVDTGQKAQNTNGDYIFRQQTVPVSGYTTYVVVHQKRWIVPGTSLRKPKTFVTPFLGRWVKSRFSEALINLVFMFSMLTSAHGAKKLLEFLGVRISDETLRRLIKAVHVHDDPDIDFIGIDDVSLRKGRSYFTVVYNGYNHHLLAILDGRDGTELEKWLKQHPKVKVVARDRAGAYASAISRVLPDAIQVADTFHLFQNLTSYLKEMLKVKLPSKIYGWNGILLDKKPDCVEVPVVPTDDPAFDSLNLSELMEENDDTETADYKQRSVNGRAYSSLAKKRDEKYQKIKDIRNYWEAHKGDGTTKAELQRMFDVSHPTLQKYLQMSEEEVEAVKQLKEMPRKRTEAEKFLPVIYKLFQRGYRGSFIFSYILHCGYEGTFSQLKNLITLIGDNNFGIKTGRHSLIKKTHPAGVVTITRFEVLKWILIKDKEELKDSPMIIYFPLIEQRYPVVRKAKEIWDRFYHIMMGDDKDPELLIDFLLDYGDSEIRPFINGLKKDIEPVVAAISSGVTSGFVEGMNNRYKQVLRMMYGRSGLNLLFHKNYAISSLYHLGMDPKHILNWKRILTDRMKNYKKNNKDDQII